MGVEGGMQQGLRLRGLGITLGPSKVQTDVYGFKFGVPVLGFGVWGLGSEVERQM